MRGSTRKHVDKRGKTTWLAIWDAPAKVDPETGAVRRAQKSKGGFRTQKDAQRFLNDTLPKVAAGTYVEPSSETLAVFLRSWLSAQTNVKPLTVNRYRQTIEGQIVPRAIGSIPLRQISPADVLAFLAELERCSDAHCDHRADCRGLAASSRMVVFAVLKRALNDAVGWDKLTRSPAARVKSPRTGQTRVMAWSPTELNRFLAHITDDRLAALWRLGAMTGMRRGELCGLRWQDVDFDAGTVRVEQQALPTPGGVTFGSPKSKRSRRTVSIDAETVEGLRDHRARQLVEQTLAGDLYEHELDLVFPDELGRVTHPNAISNQFVVRRKGAGIPVGSVHVLRHTHATIALEARCPLHVVAARIGDRPETVLATYAHLLPTSDAAVVDAVVAALGS